MEDPLTFDVKLLASGREAGRYLDAERARLAAAIVARQYELRPELRDRYGPGGQAKCEEDTRYHLAYLSAAVTFASPALFVDYITWAKGLLASFGVAEEDVDQNLVCLRDVLKELLPSDVREITLACVDAALTNSPAATAPPQPLGDAKAPLNDLARRYLDALLRTNRHEAIRLIQDAVRSGTRVQDIYLQVFQPCQREVGRLWQRRQITVAQEHFCTAATQLAISQLYPYLIQTPRNGRRALAASPSGELHELGLRLVADLFEAEGWDTMYLGASVPAESVVRAVAEFKPDLLLISATMSFHLNSVERLIAAVRSADGAENLRIMVGGYPCNIDPGLAQRLGADAHACDALEALATAEELVSVQGPLPCKAPNTPALRVDPVPGHTPAHDDRATYDELTRLNNELITTQRELARKNALLERLNRRLRRADRSKDDFLATLAHELRNPLAPIRTGLELLRLGADDPQMLAHVRAMMERQMKHLVRLVDDLLDVSRITAGKFKLDKVHTELTSIIQSAVDAARHTIDEAGHTLTVSVPDAPLHIEADPTRLAQVVSNLLTNAARYTERGGQIWLTAGCDDNDVFIKVRDTGKGIPAEMLERIFDMFTQVDHSVERSKGGLGIGLMLVRRLTEMHGGYVRAHSEGPGKGSEFVVRLPILVQPCESSAAADRKRT